MVKTGSGRSGRKAPIKSKKNKKYVGELKKCGNFVACKWHAGMAATHDETLLPYLYDNLSFLGLLTFGWRPAQLLLLANFMEKQPAHNSFKSD